MSEVSREEFEAFKQQVESWNVHQELNTIHRQLANLNLSVLRVEKDIDVLKQGQELTNNMLKQILGVLKKDG